MPVPLLISATLLPRPSRTYLILKDIPSYEAAKFKSALHDQYSCGFLEILLSAVSCCEQIHPSCSGYFAYNSVETTSQGSTKANGDARLNGLKPYKEHSHRKNAALKRKKVKNFPVF